ncbi:MAG: hypothetical protein LBD53_04190 [Tannerella sp.]|jgi:hypothetical protein|nr:hypothetical protein [Tannerella sp.]
MKKYNFIKFLTALCAVTLCILYACDNMNTIHEEYVDRGETLYIGVADSITVRSGLNKIGFEWKINADPRISKTVIYWNQRNNKVEVPVERTSESEMWLSTVVNNLEEGEYIFEFEMHDNKGNISKAIEISGLVLGDVYIENLRSRGIKEISKLVTGDMQISWEPVSATAVTLLHTVVEYINKNDEKQLIEIPNDETVTLLENLETGDIVDIYAVHMPENGFEEFNSLARKFTMPKFEREISKSRFVAAFKPGDNTTPHPGGGINDWQKPITDFGVGQRSLAKIWDGGTRNNTNGATILHTEDQSGNANAPFKFPHKFTIDLGIPATLSRIRLWARVDNGSFSGHSPRFFEVWATDAPKEIDDFASQADFETYYRTTYVVQKNPANYVANNELYTDKISNFDSRALTFLAPDPAPGINNWQQDWKKIGDFEMTKPSGLIYNQRNDADNAIWTDGQEFNFIDIGLRVRYIRLVIKFPNWQTTNCINLGEITLYGDDI